VCGDSGSRLPLHTLPWALTNPSRMDLLAARVAIRRVAMGLGGLYLTGHLLGGDGEDSIQPPRTQQLRGVG
jgi:hypothetical protein